MLEGAGSVEVEAKLRKSGLKGGWIGYGEFEFDLVCLHGVSIRLKRWVRGDRMERYVQWENRTIKR